MALRCSIRFVSSGSLPVAFARTENSGRPIPQRHSLTLIVIFSDSLALAVAHSRELAGKLDGLYVLARTI